jgi:hypothetical protein
MNTALLDSDEWDGLQDAMLFCLAIERERIPTKESELRWIEFRQYIIDHQGELTHERRLVSVTETRTNKPTKQKRRLKTLYVGTGYTIEETVWDLLEQVSKEIRVRRELRPIPKQPTKILEQVRPDGFMAFQLPRGTLCVMNHGRGCVCPPCQMKYGRVPN